MTTELNLEQKLADLLDTRDFHPEMLGKDGRPADAENAKTFSFDYVSGSGKNYGTMVVVLGSDNEMYIMYGDNLGKTIEDTDDRSEFFDFQQQLMDLANRNRWSGTLMDIGKLKRVQAGIAAIKEGLFEGYYGTRKISYTGEPTEARLMIKHNRTLGENDARFRYVESVFIETADGERFKLPFTNMSGSRAMLEHVRQGGKPYDVRGNHICEIVTEMKVLSRFNRAAGHRVMEGVTQQIVEQAQHYYAKLRESIKHLGNSRGYKTYFESWHPLDVQEQESLVEDIKTMFIEQTLDTRIEAALPLLARIQQQGNTMKEADIFESWMNQLVEGTWSLPETPEQVAKLKELMGKELIVGPDATNATEQLYDLIGDDELFDRLGELAERDPRANAWNDTEVMNRLRELGIETDGVAPAGAEGDAAPVDPAAAASVPQQGVAEGSLEEVSLGLAKRARDKAEHMVDMDYDDMRDRPYGYSEKQRSKFQRYIDKKEPRAKGDRDWDPPKKGVADGAPKDPNAPKLVQDRKTGKWYDPNKEFEKKMNSPEVKAQMKRMAQKEGVAEGLELNAMRKAAGLPIKESVLTDSTGHTLDHILKRFSREVADFKDSGNLTDDLYHALYDYYFDDMPYGTKKARDGDPYEWVTDRLDQELGTGNHAPRVSEADPISTFEVMSGFDAPVAEGSCNMTAEGEYCPEHALAECGMYEMGTVAGSMAPVMGEGTERDKHYYLRNDIWRVMDGDEVVDEYKPERYEVVGAKKLLAQYDDDNIDVTHVISPMGTVTYLYGKPEDDIDEGIVGNMFNKAKSMFTKPAAPAAPAVPAAPAAPAPVVPDAATQARIAAAPQGYDPNTGKPLTVAKAGPGMVKKGGTLDMTKKITPVAKPAAAKPAPAPQAAAPAAPAPGGVQGIKSNVDVNTLQKFNGIVDVPPKIKPQIKDAKGRTWTKLPGGWTQDGSDRTIDRQDSTYQSFDDAWRVANGAQPGNVGLAEGNDDPINYNGAITGAYYESKSDDALLARIKSLALIK